MLSKYNIHDNPFCTLIKKSDDAWTHCVSCQKKIYEKLDNKPFWGMCYAGVEEYIFPIKANEVIGFISLSGYGIDSERAYKRISKVAKEYSLNSSQLKFAYDKKLIKETPSLIEVQTIIKPLCYMLSYFFEQIPQIASSENNLDYIYSKAITYITRNFKNKLTLSQISAHCNCSTSYISHMFKKRTGHSINTYINNLRINETKSLLLNSNFPIKDISEMIGFSDSNYFCNTFKQLVGMSPREFKKENSI